MTELMFAMGRLVVRGVKVFLRLAMLFMSA
jgi:hypothetical protein